jgi:diguanylate cyclase (GGDEF)-like protein
LWQAAVQTTTSLLKILAFTEFFDTAAASLAKLLDADGAALIVYDGEDHLRYRLFYGMELINKKSIAGFRFLAHEGTVGLALDTGQHLFTFNYPASPNAMPAFTDAGIKSNLVVPLPGPNGFIGAIAIAWIHRRAGSLSPATLAIVDMFAALIGASLYREALEAKLQALSLHDPLTGLPNRRMLMARLTEAQKRACRDQTLMVVGVLDLDGFKQLNDVLGHAEGDTTLVSAAARIKEAIREIDMVVRLGGDEFVVILQGIKSKDEAKQILHRLVIAMNIHVEKAGVSVDVRASIGVTIYPLDFTDPETLLRNADEMMYLAKRSGGNKFLIKSIEPYEISLTY